MPQTPETETVTVAENTLDYLNKIERRKAVRAIAKHFAIRAAVLAATVAVTAVVVKVLADSTDSSETEA